MSITTTSAALYNEIDPFAAAWLEELVREGHVATGPVDRRSIRDLTPADVAGPGQRHFFAGIGGWSYALRQAGIRDDADVWTGSCPCQSFSGAGKQRGTADERHLWPTWYGLIRECRPPIVLGEQVASKLALAWLDDVFADLEGAGYTCAAVDIPAAGVGAPHKRQRLYWVAYAHGVTRGLLQAQREPGGADAQARRDREARARAGGLSDPAGERRREGIDGAVSPEEHGRGSADDRGALGSHDVLVGDAHGDGRQDREQAGPATELVGRSGGVAGGRKARRRTQYARRSDASRGPVGDAGRDGDPEHARELPGDESEHEGRRTDGDHASVAAGATRGFWGGADWIPCADGKARPVESGTFPLATGVPGRVGKLRGYGNSIVTENAIAFIRAAYEAIEETLTDTD